MDETQSGGAIGRQLEGRYISIGGKICRFESCTDYKKQKMVKLVFNYTYCSEPYSWEWNIPFEYESKEKFIFDVLENPMILNKLGITVYEFQITPKVREELDFITNVDEYVFTLEEWFDRNKML